MPGWDNSDRRSRLPKDWSTRRTKVLERDHYECRWVIAPNRLCLMKATDVDHIKPGDDHSYTNLQSLCADHHQMKTIAERPLRRYYSRKRPTERHPGLI